MAFVPTDYEPYDFANRRHIGPSPKEIDEMLKRLSPKDTGLIRELKETLSALALGAQEGLADAEQAAADAEQAALDLDVIAETGDPIEDDRLLTYLTDAKLRHLA